MYTEIITAEFVEKFQSIDNKKVNIYTQHILYGSQKNRGCALRTLFDRGRIGFIIDGEEKYITMDELKSVNFNGNVCNIVGDMMEFKIEVLY